MPKAGEKRTTPAEETETECRWRGLLAEQARLRLANREFAALKSVRAAQLAWWKSEIARRDRERREAPGSRLLPVRVTGLFASAPPPVLEVIFGKGVRVVRVPPGADLAHLRAVVEALET